MATVKPPVGSKPVLRPKPAAKPPAQSNGTAAHDEDDIPRMSIADRIKAAQAKANAQPQIPLRQSRTSKIIDGGEIGESETTPPPIVQRSRPASLIAKKPAPEPAQSNGVSSARSSVDSDEATAASIEVNKEPVQPEPKQEAAKQEPRKVTLRDKKPSTPPDATNNNSAKGTMNGETISEFEKLNSKFLDGISSLKKINAKDFKNVEAVIIEDSDRKLKKWPKEIEVIPELISVEIKDCAIKSVSPGSIKLPQLKRLNITSAPLKDMTAMTSLTKLQELHLVSLELDRIPSKIKELTGLRVLNLSGNKIASLPDELCDLVNLRELAVPGNKITTFPSRMRELKQLVSLDVSRNRLETLGDVFGEMGQLRSLVASCNKITSIPPSLAKASRVRHIALRCNHVIVIPSCIASMTQLETLNMNENKVSSVEDLPPNLRQLLLDHNQLSEFPQCILGCRKLEVLSLNNNNINSVPTGIKDLSLLRTIYLAENGLETLPEEIANNVCLRHLSMRRNRIKSLPPQLGDMPHLSMLDMSENISDSNFPATLGTRSIGRNSVQSYVKDFIRQSSLPAVMSSATDDV